ncbi:hypothetical protein A2852_01330 [Candidatus Adlerbacteria bacterium RIFCSPHIGHO2_01_FULL_54_23]|uniref:Macrocin-O-methyltransferase n=3 Tax=Candidatus Adleribacteriota TaxID=1752736 RepID=A0A1F4Y085_9BACT|nr:MAG: hypothetical protein UY83_C0003G0019 [Candidatus Adlerbacteria bacterium GW2011_GWA1_54_10]KKW36383.1 MAG: hypothetical protein UY84_C0001G0274 [Candidatus Adlerbacteria bacterium GW2011_GWA2_54_12]KKW37465.1 MAG: hypothetical protein UY86_C0008G0022 [Candidatus Adlerbacteria bacterium GW2011_GWB1_54_7]OGC79252.1 MAG: hypothetical protein A2852_01330 [Candidatus Adlerbacteria bacterium RIFCSPHIGHO2_01_FULL_54_23]OGC87362.1 MAG: hypothetical protein A3B33_00220 [Candidatus Adlerbacteria 
MKLFYLLRQKIGVWLVAAIRARHGVVIFFGDEERRAALDLIAAVRKEVKMLLSDHEAYQLIMAARRTAKIPGDIAEVGTYRGGSSKLIARSRAAARPMHLFDTFEGLPQVREIDSKFDTGQYGADFKQVKRYLSGYPDIFLYKGIFPATADPIKDKKFSFVHLDVDLYDSTKQALEFFYPRMSRGGVIISHDYMTAQGVRKAVDEFMQDKPEAVFESSWQQCFIVKL